ncbi:MAG: hypothetical protein QCI38_05735, partial [Candidatus Thermoplasmatota archaeon]|nr:hypothetical protein [Candidatus Thermoplasmatota archaeon]
MAKIKISVDEEEEGYQNPNGEKGESLILVGGEDEAPEEDESIIIVGQTEIEREKPKEEARKKLEERQEDGGREELITVDSKTKPKTNEKIERPAPVEKRKENT